MKAIYPFGSRDFRLVDLPDPIPAAGQVLVAVKASGICGSDKWLWREEHPIQQVHGHEVAGEVVALGRDVHFLQVGDRVAVNNVVGCGECPACRSGAFVLCPRWDGSQDVGGGFGELVAAPERNCLRLAEEIDFETGCQIFDNFGTPYNAIDWAKIGPADDVLVSGLGPIGLAAVILASLRGAYVIALDPLPYRQELALKFGARLALAPGKETAETVRHHTDGLGVKVALECSGKAPAYPIAQACLRHQGTLIVIGEGGQWDLRPSELVIRKHLSIVGSWYSSMSQGSQIQDLILQKKLDPKVLVTHRGPLAEFPRLFQQVCEFGDQVVKAVIVNP